MVSLFPKDILGEKKEKDKKSSKSLGDIQGDNDFVLESSEKPIPKLDCSDWPLLLKVLFTIESYPKS